MIGKIDRDYYKPRGYHLNSMLRTNNKIQNENFSKSEVPSWLPKEKLNEKYPFPWKKWERKINEAGDQCGNPIRRNSALDIKKRGDWAKREPILTMLNKKGQPPFPMDKRRGQTDSHIHNTSTGLKLELAYTHLPKIGRTSFIFKFFATRL